MPALTAQIWKFRGFWCNCVRKGPRSPTLLALTVVKQLMCQEAAGLWSHLGETVTVRRATTTASALSILWSG